MISVHFIITVLRNLLLQPTTHHVEEILYKVTLFTNDSKVQTIHTLYGQSQDVVSTPNFLQPPIEFVPSLYFQMQRSEVVANRKMIGPRDLSGL